MIQTVALIAIFISFLMGIAYVSLGLVPQLRTAQENQQASYPHYYELVAAPIFVVAQGIAAFLLWQGDANFFSWILPPATYLALIGLLCWIKFSRRDMLALDTGRGLTLVVLSVFAWLELVGEGVNG